MSTPVTEISGIGHATADILKEHGFGTAESIATSAASALAVVPGFGPIRSKNVIAAAKKVASAAKKSTAGKAKAKKKKAPKSSPKSKSKAKSKASI